MLPRHTHDCEKCSFKGYFLGYDVYKCEQGGLGATLIARWSDEGPDYQSLPIQLLPRVVAVSPLWAGVKAVVDVADDPNQSYIMWK